MTVSGKSVESGKCVKVRIVKKISAKNDIHSVIHKNTVNIQTIFI
jgi:hypothetical protein